MKTSKVICPKCHSILSYDNKIEHEDVTVTFFKCLTCNFKNYSIHVNIINKKDESVLKYSVDKLIEMYGNNLDLKYINSFPTYLNIDELIIFHSKYRNIVKEKEELEKENRLLKEKINSFVSDKNIESKIKKEVYIRFLHLSKIKDILNAGNFIEISNLQDKILPMWLKEINPDIIKNPPLDLS